LTVIFFADLVLLNGKVITVDDEDTIAEAVAIKDGKVLLVGASREVEKLVAENTKVIELDGRTVVPGFIDAHVHFDATAVFTKLAETYHIPPVRYVEVTCSINSLDEMLDKIKEKARETPNEKWIIGKGRLVQPYPTRWQLDQAAPEHPVMIHCSGHNQILNNIALEKSGITKDKPTQEELDRLAPGGRIWRNPETGEPTGLITECWDYIFPQSPWPYEKIKEAIKKECNEALRFGITTIHNFYGWSEIPRIFLELQRNGELPIRVHQSPCVYGNRKTVELDCLLNLGLETGFGDEWIKFGSAKMFVDTLGINEEGVWVEWNRITQKKLDEYVIKAHEAGIRVMMHSLTRGGHIAALEAVERALKKTPKKDHRHRIEHFGGIFWEQEYEKLKKLSVMAVPTHGWSTRNQATKPSFSRRC
jgi:predicted amidohydrolase YtcJ